MSLCGGWRGLVYFLICKSPQLFRSMVTVLLLLTCTEKLGSGYRVVYVPLLVQFETVLLVLERYQESKKYYTDIFIELINGIISHLEYPLNQFSSKESEDKFKEFFDTISKAPEGLYSSSWHRECPYPANKPY